MNKRQLNGIKRQLNKDLLMHNITLPYVVPMELEHKKMNKKQLNGIKKQLNKDMPMHNIILVYVMGMELE